MKKLSVFSVALLAASAVFADAQVYEMTITLKSTVAASGKITPVVCDLPAQEVDLYRKQSTVKIKGLLWGCDCETIAEPEFVSSAEATYGYIFWNETTRKPMNLKFEWEFLNRIDKTAKKAEGTWTLSSADGTFYLMGSGFGTIKDTTVREPICMRTATWLPNMSGSFAGWSTPGAIVTVEATEGECSWCKKVAATEAQTASAPGWTMCDCGESDTRTAANGTWKLKFDKKASDILSSETKAIESVTQAYKFPSYVKSVIE